MRRILGTSLVLGAVAAIAVVAVNLHVADLGTKGATGGTTASGAPSRPSNGWRTVGTFTNADLKAITCVNTTECWAVGDTSAPGTSGLGLGGPIIERYFGDKWETVPSPRVVGGTLDGIACPTSTDCWAVGTVDETQPVLEHYSGSTWSLESLPPLPDAGGSLNAVVCLGTSDCWAVGGPGPAIVHYSGGTWSPASAPALATGTLFGIACPSASQCWAVGESQDGAATTIERYSGGVWTLVSNPETNLAAGPLVSIACADVNQCWAVGGTGADGVIDHYARQSWAAASTSGELNATVCSSATACWAVGSTNGGTPLDLPDLRSTPSGDAAYLEPEQPVIEQYMGAAWTTASPSIRSAGAGLTSITCVGAEECWVTGVSESASFIDTNSASDTSR